MNRSNEKPTRVKSSESYLSPETLVQLKSLELRSKKIIEGIRSGLHTSPHKGMSVEFKQHRTYSPGDDLRHLDWKVLARSDRPTVKQYEQETTLDVEILIDCSASMRYSSTPIKEGWGGTPSSERTNKWTKYDHCTAIAAAVSWMVIQNSDRVGVSLFSEGVIKSIPRSSSKEQWKNVIHLLSREPAESGTDIERSCKQALATTTRKSLFIILSDFLVNTEDIKSSLARFSQDKHDVVCIQTLDDEEIHLKSKTQTLFKGMESETNVSVDPNTIRDSYLRILNKHNETIFRASGKFGFDHLVLNTHESIAPPLAKLAASRTGWLKSHDAS